MSRQQYIDGIYNYCDRWCERCAFTSQCHVYAMEAADASGPEAKDIRNAAFWKHMQEILGNTARMLEKMAKERGIDLSESRHMPARRRRTSDPRSRKLLKDCHDYAMSVHKWFEENQSMNSFPNNPMSF